MAKIVIMPKQGQSVETCIITEWFKKKGEAVVPGDILFSYETDKASFEEEAKDEGTLLEIFYNAGDEVPVLTNVCVIGRVGESVDVNAPETASSVAVTANTPEKDISVEIVKPVVSAGKKDLPLADQSFQRISPRARNLAASEAIDISGIKGSGPNGRIIERDVREILESSPKVTPLAKKLAAEENIKPVEKGTGLAGAVTSRDLVSGNPVYSNDFEVKPLTHMRKLIAKAMHASLQNSAQLTHHLGADARRIISLRNKVKDAVAKGYPVNITLNDMVCFATIKALKKFPQVNSHLLGDSMKLFSKVHLGLAVDTERGLMVPVIRNADDLSIVGLANQFKEIANSCKKGNISPELLASDAATFTVSNLGNYGVEIFTPVINLPQTAILGVNTIVPRPKDLGDGAYGFVPYIGLSLTYDHRALDGGEATRFVKQVAIEIENLEFEL